ncbi:MAG TPA: prepilin peptidase [bacterium]|mgnify:CR=1 FL=1|nr:prepilin peptidase [bacterium]
MIAYYLIIFLLGLTLGSFFNVLIHRLPKGESIIRPRSHCPGCGTSIRFYDNIPLVGYLLLRGRCRACGAAISVRYPLVELLSGAALLSVAVRYGQSPETLIFGMLVCFLIPIGVIDFHTRLILNRLTMPGIIAGVVLIFLLRPERWKDILFGALGGGLLLLFFAVLGKLLFKKESLGMGDVKLMILIGVYVGFPDVLIAFYSGVVLAGLFILGGMAVGKIRMGNSIAFGPFIASGAYVYVLWGDWMTRILFR